MLELFHATTVEQLTKGLRTARVLVTIVAGIVIIAALFVPALFPGRTWLWMVAGAGVIVGLLLVWRMEVFRWRIKEERKATASRPGG